MFVLFLLPQMGFDLVGMMVAPLQAFLLRMLLS